jgi:hypothetical protein
VEVDPSALHEASRSVAAFALGRRLGPAAVRGANGRAFHHPPRFAAEVVDGLEIEDPFCLWPPEIKTRFEGDAIVSLAGYIGEEALIPRIGRVPDPVTERALTLVEEITPDAGELPPLTAAERQRLDTSFDRGSSWSDEQEIAKVVCTAHGPDLASAASWLAFCRAQCVAFVLGHGQQIRRLAMVLAEAGSLSGQAVAALLDERPPCSSSN